MQIIKGKYNCAHVMIDEIDSETRGQIQGFVNNPSFAGSHIAIMPDCHKGAGSCIGFTMQMMDIILDNIKETVDIVEMVKPIYNFKAGGE